MKNKFLIIVPFPLLFFIIITSCVINKNVKDQPPCNIDFFETLINGKIFKIEKAEGIYIHTYCGKIYSVFLDIDFVNTYMINNKRIQSLNFFQIIEILTYSTILSKQNKDRLVDRLIEIGTQDSITQDSIIQNSITNLIKRSNNLCEYNIDRLKSTLLL
jgi:hypothetical protein